MRPWRSWRLGGYLLWVGLLTTTGCATPAALRDDIVTIYHYYRVEPWVRDEEGRVSGLLARVYFVPAGDNKGCFVPGTIKAQLFALDRRSDGTYVRNLAHEWSYNPQEADGFRIVKRAEMGESYGFVLRWPHALDLSGREVELRFSYIRQDSRTIVGRGKSFQVPSPAGKTPRGGASGQLGKPAATRPSNPPATPSKTTPGLTPTTSPARRGGS